MLFPKNFEDVCKDKDLVDEYKACRKVVQVLFEGKSLTGDELARVNALNFRVVVAGFSSGMCLITK